MGISFVQIVSDHEKELPIMDEMNYSNPTNQITTTESTRCPVKRS